MPSNVINLVEDNKVISDDRQLAHIFNDFFSNAVDNLKISYVEPYVPTDSFVNYSDFVVNAISKYEKHPSIIKIKDNFKKGNSFSFKPVDIMAVCKEIDHLDSLWILASKSNKGLERGNISNNSLSF